MVRRRRPIQKRRKTNPPIRQEVRRLARATTFEPRRAVVPVDPPSILPMHTFNFTSHISCVTADNSAFISGLTWEECILGFAHNDTSHYISSAELNTGDLWDVFLQMTGIKTVDLTYKGWEMCLRKVCLWGPSQQTYSGVAVAIYSEPSPPFAQYCVKDRGAVASRARVGITFPYTRWFKADQGVKLLTFDLDATSTYYNLGGIDKLASGIDIGLISISYSVRTVSLA